MTKLGKKLIKAANEAVNVKFTAEEIEGWLKKAAEECRDSNWQTPYRHGYLQGLNAVQREMDDARAKKAR